MRNYTFAIIAAVVVASLATLVLSIGARSPYTHANLSAEWDPGYGRTAQIVVGPPEGYRGPGRAASLGDSADPVPEGKALLFSRGCPSCHGLEGRGGAVGPPIIGFNASDLRAKTMKGPGGMPAYEPLPDADLEAMAAYLRSLVK